jgi:hypothetical protein
MSGKHLAQAESQGREPVEAETRHGENKRDAAQPP